MPKKYDMLQYQIDATTISDEEKAKCIYNLCDFEPSYCLPEKLIDSFWCREALAQRLIKDGFSEENAYTYSESIRKGLLNEVSHPQALQRKELMNAVEPELFKAIGQVRYLTSLERCKKYLSSSI